MLSAILRLVVGALLAIAILPAAAGWFVLTLRRVHGLPPDWAALALGLGAGLALVWWRRPNWLIHTLIHEACHAVACLLLGVRIRSFRATDGRGGAVAHDRVGPIRGTLILLAPYLLPLLLAPALLARWFWTDGGLTRQILAGLIGLLTIHHLHGLFHNLRLNFWGRQADLSRAGKVLSLVAIAGVHCAWGVLWLRAVYRG